MLSVLLLQATRFRQVRKMTVMVMRLDAALRFLPLQMLFLLRDLMISSPILPPQCLYS